LALHTVVKILMRVYPGKDLFDGFACGITGLYGRE
jgi:hypothetical protein